MNLGRNARVWSVLLAAAACLSGSGRAFAQQFGNGHDGPLVVNDRDTINQSALVTADVKPGDFILRVNNSTAFLPGSQLLVIQMQANDVATRSQVGGFEVRRITRVSGTEIEVEDPMTHAFAGNMSQVVTLPEYSTVTIAPDAGLVAPPWNGTGGVLAFMVSGRLNNGGILDARGSGFRGGTGRTASGENGGCTRLDEPQPGGAERGEGAVAGGFGAAFTGRGNNDTGGGGSVCAYSGGGGGGHRGEGGIGGFNQTSTLNGGLPGVRLEGSGLVLGGGGGASNGLDDTQRNGGAGGGIVFIAALELAGEGLIVSDGSPGGSITLPRGGASGGGAGGTVWLEVAGDAVCHLSAKGGTGGNSVASGPGGGGGGGYIRLQAQVVRSCTTAVTGGSPGLANGMAFGAGPPSPEVAPNVGAVDVTDVYGEQVPIPIKPELKTALVAVGCGCNSSGGTWLWLLWLLPLRLRRRQRTSGHPEPVEGCPRQYPDRSPYRFRRVRGRG